MFYHFLELERLHFIMIFFKLENFDEAKDILNFFLFSKFNKESENDEYIFVNHI
jgi:hypothetical protein